MLQRLLFQSIFIDMILKESSNNCYSKVIIAIENKEEMDNDILDVLLL